MTDRATRIVITGVGAITAAGTDRERSWARLLSGESFIGPLQAWDCSSYPTGLAAEVRDFDPVTHFGAKRARKLDRCHQLALVAAREAVADARLSDDAPDPSRVAVIVGSSLGGTLSAQRYARLLLREKRLVPRYLRSYLLHACLEVLTEEFGFRGPRTVFSTACTASTLAIAYALEVLRTGRADVVLTGGFDPLTEFSFAGFSSMSNVSSAPCAPFSEPVGLSMGEGAAMMVLEREDRAERRQARVRAQLLGYGLTADAHHLTSPDPAGRAQLGAARKALQMAGIGPHEVGYVNAHGTGTAGNDPVESRTLQLLLGDKAGEVPVSSLKGALGHTLGAAGGVEAAMTALAVERGVLPPTANFTQPRAGCDLDYIPRAPREKQVQYALSLNYAFGGNNAALVLGAPDAPALATPAPPRRVVITGMGLVTPIACSAEELHEALRTERTGITSIRRFDTEGLGSSLGGVLEDFSPERFTRASVRRMDRVGCLTVCAAELALRHSGLRVTAENQERVGLVAGTVQGPAASCERFFQPVALGNGQRANPALFPNTVVNAGVGLAAIQLRIKGANIALSSGQASGLNALCIAYDLIRAGVAEMLLAGGVDELERCVLEGYAAARRIAPHERGGSGQQVCAPFDRRRSGLVLGEGGAFLALESLESALARGARIYGEVVGYHANADRPRVRGWEPSGEDLARCMSTALEEAGLEPAAIDFVGAGAMSHPLHDQIEARALHRVFGGRRVPVAALASRVGVSAVTAPLTVCAAALGMEEGFLPGGVEYEQPDPTCELELLHGPGRPGRIGAALINAVSLGGSNYSLILKRWER